MAMVPPAQVVSIHPYFKVKPGQMATARKVLDQFVARTKTEPKALYYDFTVRGDMIFCREAYVGGQGALDHLQNIGAVLQEFLQHVDLMRLEIHGAAVELELLKGAVGALNPEWYVFECGMAR
jgi:quinol monooxygenase YgiN